MDKQKLLTWPPAVMFFAFICAMLWGSGFPILKIGFLLLDIEKNTGGKIYFAAYRFLFAGLIIFTFLLISGKQIKLSHTRDYFTILLLGLLQVQYIFFYIGLSNTTGMKASIITGSGSFFLALFSHWWMKDDRLTPRKIAGLFIGFLGILIVNFNKDQFNFDFRLTGEGFIILNSISSILGFLIVKYTSVRIYPPLLSAYQLILGAIVMFIIAFQFESPSVITFSLGLILILLYLSFATATAFSLWYLLIKYNKLSNIAVYRFLIPVCGALLSAAVLSSESFTWISLLSLVLVSFGMITITKN